MEIPPSSTRWSSLLERYSRRRRRPGHPVSGNSRPVLRYAYIHVIFISWAVDQQHKDIEKVRGAAKGYGVGYAPSWDFSEIHVDLNEDKFHADLKAKLDSHNGPGNLIIIVYLGNSPYLGSISADQTSVARIRPLRSTGILRRTAGHIHWNLGDLDKTKADILFVSNFSRDFLRCLMFLAQGTENRHRVELVTFNATAPEYFAQSLLQFNELMYSASELADEGFTIDEMCREFNKWSHELMVSAKSSLFFSKRYVLARHDALSETDKILLAEACHVFRPTHMADVEEDFFRKRSKLSIAPTGSGAELWKVYLDYDDHEGPGPSLIHTVCVAVKKFKPPKDNNTTMQQQALRKTFLSERKNLESMRKWPHPNILAMLGSFERSTPPSYNLVFPFAEGGSLFNFMRVGAVEHEDPSQIYPHASIICDEYAAWEHGILDECLGLLDALSYIHHGIQGNLILHRDIKPANILIHNRKFMLADFGEAHIKATYEGATSKTRRGAWTPAYSPPELFQPNIDEKEARFGRGLDVWGLGCVFLELVVMLAHIRHEHVPSVVEFEDLRISWSTGNRRGSEKYPANAFAGNKCIDEVVFMISNLGDPHLTILLEVVQMMLVDDWTQRPRASNLHTCMKQAYTLLRESPSHVYQEPPSIESPESEQQPIPSLDLPAPDALARFWYEGFLKNNHWYYYWLYEIPFILLACAAIGLGVALMMCVALADKLTKMGKDVDAIFWAILCSFGGLGVVFVLILLGRPLCNLCLVLCVFRPQAHRYVRARADISRGTEQQHSSLRTGLMLSGKWHRSVWSWICERGRDSFQELRRRRLRRRQEIEQNPLLTSREPEVESGYNDELSEHNIDNLSIDEHATERRRASRAAHYEAQFQQACKDGRKAGQQCWAFVQHRLIPFLVVKPFATIVAVANYSARMEAGRSNNTNTRGAIAL